MHFSAVIILLALLLAGCQKPETGSSQAVGARQEAGAISRNGVSPDAVGIVTAIGQRARLTNTRLAEAVQTLEPAVAAFLETPDEASLTELKSRWINAHSAYAIAQFGILVKDSEIGQTVFRIDAWPIQPGFIDSLPEYPMSGIILDQSLALTQEALLNQHGITDEEEVAVGFHALEYLIFARPLSDFILPKGDAGIDADVETVQRRRTYLRLATNQLARDTAQLINQSQAQLAASDYTSAMNTIERYLSDTLKKMRVAFRESSLLTAGDNGHSLYSGTSLQTLQAEITSLQDFMLDEVPFGPLLESIDANTYSNFRATLAELDRLISDSDADEVSRANLPLLLSALTHQLETFDRMLAHQFPRD